MPTHACAGPTRRRRPCPKTHEDGDAHVAILHAVPAVVGAQPSPLLVILLICLALAFRRAFRRALASSPSSSACEPPSYSCSPLPKGSPSPPVPRAHLVCDRREQNGWDGRARRSPESDVRGRTQGGALLPKAPPPSLATTGRAIGTDRPRGRPKQKCGRREHPEGYWSTRARVWWLGAVVLERHMVHMRNAPAQPAAPLAAQSPQLPGASLELDDGRDRRRPAGRADALRVGTEAGPVPRSHGNSLDTNLDTFVRTQPGQSGRRGQGATLHRSQIGPPPLEAETFTSAYSHPAC